MAGARPWAGGPLGRWVSVFFGPPRWVTLVEPPLLTEPPLDQDRDRDLAAFLEADRVSTEGVMSMQMGSLGLRPVPAHAPQRGLGLLLVGSASAVLVCWGLLWAAAIGGKRSPLSCLQLRRASCWVRQACVLADTLQIVAARVKTWTGRCTPPDSRLVARCTWRAWTTRCRWPSR